MHSLSARLLVLTVFFVMLSEVLIFVPSVARFRIEWLGARMSAAHLAMLVVDAAPNRAVGEMLKADLLTQVGAHVVVIHRSDMRMVLSGGAPPQIDESFDLAAQGWWEKVIDALAVYTRRENRVIRAVSPSPADPAISIELVLDEAPLHRRMVGYGLNVFGLSVVISLITASLVYLSLHWLLVRPMRRIIGSMADFSENPEDARRIIVPAGGRDEIGVAEEQLATMQRGLRDALAQKAHLAALGTAVAKINHDLRGILSSALLVSDRLETSGDPDVQRLAPTVITAIERAVAMCSQTLDYVGQGATGEKRTHFPLQPLVHEIKTSMEAPAAGGLRVENRVIDAFHVVGDRDQIFRILNNVARNAAEAGAGSLTVSAHLRGDCTEIDLADDGPGLPPRAQDKLFQPFEGSARAGGTGLGLAIARELARGHGGDLVLLSTGPEGTAFRLMLPLDTDHHGSVTKTAESV
ncbi:MAG: HAMP domain-containing histidine kinase [Alphaproteobacteria bacterium]|nr:HAMP domain-containing histidine kinase [Alphaproteobacteria bacterium]